MRTATNPAWEHYTYIYDDKGQILNETQYSKYSAVGSNKAVDKTVEITNTYDEIGRLTKAINDITDSITTSNTKVTTTSYVYDNVGNRAQQDDGEEVLKYTYDAFNKLTEIHKKDHGANDSTLETYASYVYDVLGRQTEEDYWYKPSGSDQKLTWSVQTYNAAGEMFSNAQRNISNPNGGAEYYFTTLTANAYGRA